MHGGTVPTVMLATVDHPLIIKVVILPPSLSTNHTD